MRWTSQQYNEWLAKRGTPVVGLQNPQRQPDQRSEGEDRKLEERQSRMGFRIGIVSVRKKLVDEHDNLRTGAKPLVDAITASLGFANDNDPRLTWEYGQVLGTRCGTIVKIERL